MIILHEKLLESENKKQSHSASPSSFFKSKWIEENEQKKTFDHLYREEVEDTLKDRLYLKKSTISDYEKFIDIMAGTKTFTCGVIKIIITFIIFLNCWNFTLKHGLFISSGMDGTLLAPILS